MRIFILAYYCWILGSELFWFAMDSRYLYNFSAFFVVWKVMLSAEFYTRGHLILNLWNELSNFAIVFAWGLAKYQN